MHYFAHAKVNIFLKIVGTRGNYHELYSRFMRVRDLYDTLSFVPKQTTQAFELVGDFNCALEHNTLYKIYRVLQEQGFSKEIERVMQTYALHVKKQIPTGAGLGGGSSDAATFLRMLNDRAGLFLSNEEMMLIGSRVGADVAFFASGYESANVSGIGEIVASYEEEALELEVFTPNLACDTARVYTTFREFFLASIAPQDALPMLSCKSAELLASYEPQRLNDLYAACLKAYPELPTMANEGWFFSGSGSSFFRIKAH